MFAWKFLPFAALCFALNCIATGKPLRNVVTSERMFALSIRNELHSSERFIVSIESCDCFLMKQPSRIASTMIIATGMQTMMMDVPTEKLAPYSLCWSIPSFPTTSAPAPVLQVSRTVVWHPSWSSAAWSLRRRPSSRSRCRPATP